MIMWIRFENFYIEDIFYRLFYFCIWYFKDNWKFFWVVMVIGCYKELVNDKKCFLIFIFYGIVLYFVGLWDFCYKLCVLEV